MATHGLPVRPNHRFARNKSLTSIGESTSRDSDSRLSDSTESNSQKTSSLDSFSRNSRKSPSSSSRFASDFAAEFVADFVPSPESPVVSGDFDEEVETNSDSEGRSSEFAVDSPKFAVDSPSAKSRSSSSFTDPKLSLSWNCLDRTSDSTAKDFFVSNKQFAFDRQKILSNSQLINNSRNFSQQQKQQQQQQPQEQLQDDRMTFLGSNFDQNSTQHHRDSLPQQKLHPGQRSLQCRLWPFQQNPSLPHRDPPLQQDAPLHQDSSYDEDEVRQSWTSILGDRILSDRTSCDQLSLEKDHDLLDHDDISEGDVKNLAPDFVERSTNELLPNKRATDDVTAHDFSEMNNVTPRPRVGSMCRQLNGGINGGITSETVRDEDLFSDDSFIRKYERNQSVKDATIHRLTTTTTTTTTIFSHSRDATPGGASVSAPPARKSLTLGGVVDESDADGELKNKRSSSVISLILNSKKRFLKRRNNSGSSSDSSVTRTPSLLSLEISWDFLVRKSTKTSTASATTAARDAATAVATAASTKPTNSSPLPVYKFCEKKHKKRQALNTSPPTHFRPIGTLVRLNPDGTRVVRLTKPPHGPYGFYIAKGSQDFQYGIIVSRLSDSYPHSFFSGLIGIGDQIMSIGDYKIDHRCSLDLAYDLMTSFDTCLTMTILPFVFRRLGEVIEESEDSSRRRSSGEGSEDSSDFVTKEHRDWVSSLSDDRDFGNNNHSLYGDDDVMNF